MNLYVKTYRHRMLCIYGAFQPKHLLLKNKALIMRISILAIFLTFSGLLMARSGSGQDLNKIIISLDLKDASLKQAFKKIESLTQLAFTYRTVDVVNVGHISYHAANAPVTQVLEDLLQHTGLKYDQLNSNIVIKKIRKNDQAAEIAITEELPFEGSIHGRITDETGAPLANASIVLIGTDKGTAADFKGEFIIAGIKAGNYRLQVSAVGFQTLVKEVTVKDDAVAEVSFELSAGNDKLDEVVVTALGIKREKRSLGYSTQEIKGEDLSGTRQTNILNAMRGKVAGVQINSGGGAPGQGTRIIIRGIKSLDPTKNNQPLFVIDGILIDNSTTAINDQGSLRGLSNRAADINPDDIESISILKGGAATALYGQAGSNGVVVINTKTAKAGKMRVNFSTTYGIDEVNKFPEVQKKFTQGYVGASSFIPEYDPKSFWPSWGPTVEEAKKIDPTHPDEIYHHYKQAFKTGNQFRTSINLSGGTEKALITTSLSYSKQNGVIPNSDYKNISARLGGQFKFSEKLRFTPGLYFINSGGYRVNADRFNESLTYWSPRWNVMDYEKADGTQNSYGNNNPVYGTATNKFKDNVNRIIGNAAFTYSPLKWLDIDYKFGIDQYSDFRRHAAPGPKGIVGEVTFGDNNLGFVNEYRIGSRILNSNVMVSFKKEWFGKLSTLLRMGNEVRDRKFTRLTATGTELDIPDLLTLNNAKVRGTSQLEENYRIVSAYGDLTLGWNNYLFLNVTGRNEWSSSLPVSNNSFFYPSASLSYVFSDHIVMPGWINFGKARMSVAAVGKDANPYEINRYYTPTVITSTQQIMWTRKDQAGDPLLQPERTSTVEAGVELRLFDRIGLDFTWYKINSRQLIIPVALSPTTGFTGFTLNAGEIENKGIEVVLNATPIKKKNFNWTTTVNFTRNRNVVESIRDGLTEITVGSHFGYSNSTVTLKYVPGSPVGNMYGTSYLRYYGSKTDDGVTVDKSLPIVIQSGSTGGFPLRDTKQRLLGNSQPKWLGGITNTFSYKDFSLSFLWETQQGLDRYNQLGNFMSAFGIAKYTENRTEMIVFEGVLPDGTPNTQSVYLGMGKVNGTGRDYGQGFYRNVHRGVTENFVEDASWVRLRNVILGYSVPEKIFKGLPIQGLTVSFTGNNLLLFTNYSGYDPESSSSSTESNADGFAGFTYPALRSYLFSVNINF